MGWMKTQPYLKNLVETMEHLAFQLWEIPYSLNLKQATYGDARLGVDSLQQLIMVYTSISTSALFLISVFKTNSYMLNACG